MVRTTPIPYTILVNHVFLTIHRIHRSRQTRQGVGHPPGSVQEQKMGVQQLVRVGAGAHHVQVPGFVRGTEEVAHCEGGFVPVPQHVPVGQCWVTGECYKGVFENGRGEDGERQRAERPSRGGYR